MDKSIVLIDGVSLHGTAKALGFSVDYKRLLNWVKGDLGSGVLVRAYYCTVVDDSTEYSSIRPLVDWLDYNGFSVVSKPTRQRDDGRRKGSISVELTVTAMRMIGKINHVYLFTGDGEYTALVHALKDAGIVVTLVSSLETKPSPHVEDGLRRAADEFLDLNAIRDAIERDPAGQA
jgi:uncharacterized LabA/DUF88 family protein